MPIPPQVRQRLTNPVDAFCARDRPGETLLVAALESFLVSQPIYAEPYTSDLQRTLSIRLACATNIENAIREDLPDYKLTAIHAAIILSVPLDELTKGYLDPTSQFRPLLKTCLDGMTSLVKHFLISQKSSLADARQDNEKDACANRDNHACIFLHTGKGEVAHIVPITWNENADKINETRLPLSWSGLLFTRSESKRLKDLCVKDVGCSDKRWNMVYLNRQIHFWWTRGYLGLKFHGWVKASDNDTSENPEVIVKVQFHWLDRRTRNASDEIPITGDASSMRAMAERQMAFEQDGSPSHQRGEEGGIISAFRVDMCTPIVSGHIAEVKMPEQDAQKFKALLELRWSIIRIAAMSGAAENPELLPDPEPDFDW